MCLAYNLTNPPNLLIIFLNFFHNTLDAAQTTTSLNCRIPLMCVHTSHRPYRYPFFTLHSWQWTHEDPWWGSKHFCCHCMKCWFPCGMRTTTCTSLIHFQFLPLTNRHCVHQKWNLHLSWHCHNWPNVCRTTSLILHNSRICCLWYKGS
jgi:hypothetical protein